MQTRKYPSTLVEAFGPYANGPVHPPERPMDSADKIVLKACAVAFIAVVILILAGAVQ